MSDLYLSDQEVRDLTQYKLVGKQIEVLQLLGIRYVLLRDRTVRVMRMHCMHPSEAPALPRPQLRMDSTPKPQKPLSQRPAAIAARAAYKVAQEEKARRKAEK